MKKSESNVPMMILRIFLGVAFLIAGLDKILSFDGTKGMFEGMFGGAGFAMLLLAIVIEIVGGISLVSGYWIKYSAPVLGVLIFVAFVATFKLGMAPNIVATLREIFVMNTGGGNTAVNLAFLAGLVSLTVNEWLQE